MNRTLSSPASSQIVPPMQDVKWLNRQEFSLPVEDAIASAGHSCFAPIHYEPGYAYPLIVWLHGNQSNEDELPQVMPLISSRNYVAIAPRGSRRVDHVPRAYTWNDSPTGIAEAADRVADCLSIARDRYNIHPDRIFVAGHSVGGTMAHRLALELPDQFAGAISLGGRVPRGSRILKHFNRLRKQPLLLSISPTEGVYSVDDAMSDLRFVHSAGLSLSLRIYPDGDELTTEMLKDMNSWIMDQFCSTESALAS